MGWSSLFTDPPSSHGRAREKSGRKDGLCTLKRRCSGLHKVPESASKMSALHLQHEVLITCLPLIQGSMHSREKPTNINQPKLFESGIALLLNFFKYFLPGLHRKLKKIGLARRDLANKRTFLVCFGYLLIHTSILK